MSGKDYPETFQQFDEWFATEAKCVEYLTRLRWPNGFQCPKCDAVVAPWQTGKGLLMCAGCGHQASVRAGTIFHRSRLPLKTWFAAMWFVCASKSGVSAMTLQRSFGFGSYETAWVWMQKLRRAMVMPARDLLGGVGETVEIDQTFIGGRKKGGKSGPRYVNKSEVVIAVERKPGQLGRVRMRRIDSTNKASELFDFIRDNVAHGTHIVTDGDTAYAAITKKLQFRHSAHNLSVAGAPSAHTVLPAVHMVASLLKRWLAGTMHHGQTPTHLDYYLDEYVFRFNRRSSKSRGLLWYRLLEQAIKTGPHPLSTLRQPHPVTGT